MAYICDDCFYVFSKKRNTCPVCGRRVQNDPRPERVLLASGYTWAPGHEPRQTTPSATATQTNQSTPQSVNPITAELKGAYQQQHTNPPSSPAGPIVPPTSQVQAQPIQEQPLPEPVPRIIPITPPIPNTPQDPGYFGQTGNQPEPIEPIPTVPYPPISDPEPVVTLENDPYQNRIDELNRQQERLRQEQERFRRRAERREFWNRLGNIRWGTGFRVLGYIFLAICAITIWKMRYVIFNSLLSFLISLIPLFLLIWIYWLILRGHR